MLTIVGGLWAEVLDVSTAVSVTESKKSRLFSKDDNLKRIKVNYIILYVSIIK